MREQPYKQSYEGENTPNDIPRPPIYLSHEIDVHPDQLMVRRYLESMDENALHMIFIELIGHTGRSHEEINFVPFSKVQIVNALSLGWTGLYSSLSKQISLNAKSLSENPARTLHVLIHEELHAISDSSHFVSTEEFEIKDIKMGVHNVITKRPTDKMFSDEDIVVDQYEAANEGITELITNSIVDEYLKRTGDTNLYGKDQLEQSVQFSKYEHSYSKYQNAIRFFISVISTISNIPEDVVTASITRTYLRSSQILPPELQSELELRMPGLSIKMHHLLNSQDPEQTWSDLAKEIIHSPTFSADEHLKIMNITMQIYEEEVVHLLKQNEQQ